MKGLRWDPCVFQSEEVCEHFLRSFFAERHRRCLFVAGCGFDPRALEVSKRLASATFVRAVFFREERPNPQPVLRPHADDHEAQLRKLFNDSVFRGIDIFDEGKTAVGGRRAVSRFSEELHDHITDVVIDISALSAGIFFPLIRAALLRSEERARKGAILNVHLFAVEEPSFDNQIRGMPGDAVTFMHGFRSPESLDAVQDRPLLWLPTLALGSAGVLTRIHSFISKSQVPIDVCPIVPFPAQDPRLPDKLAVEFHEALSSWKTDGRSFLYAAESDPLDCYRTICAIVEARDRTFEALGGSSVVLSPVGNKLLSVGAMMAAIERDLPVAMVESVGYDEEEAAGVLATQTKSQLHHVWLAGEAYFTTLENRSTPNEKQ